jgi:hypothetical protein
MSSAPETTTLDEALRLASLGHKVFALAPNAKCPRAGTRGVHDATADPDTLAACWRAHPDANLGLALGGVLVVDIDDPDTPWPGDAERAAELQMTAGAIQETSRGVHMLFRTPDGVDLHSTSGKIAPGVDIKTDAGSYIVVAPSVVNGRPYHWRTECALDVAPESLPLPPAWLVDEIALASNPTNRASLAVVQPAPPTAPAETIERARAYLAGVMPAPVRGQRGGAMLWAARALVRGFMLDDDAARPLLVEHNDRFDPPWPPDEAEREIDRKLAEARRLPFDKPDGWLLAPDTTGGVDLSLIAPSSRPHPPIERFRPFPTEALPEPVRSYVEQAAASINLHTASIAMPLLAALASAIGNSRIVRIKSDWKEPCVLWSMIVARTGDAKSPGLDAAVGFLRSMDQRAIAAWRRATREHQKNKKASKRAKQDAPDDDPPPPPKRCTLQDTTIEAAAAALESNPRGLLLERDELSGFFASFDAYRKGGAGKDRAFWIAAHGARPYVKDRSTQPLIAVERATVSITGVIQPGVLQSATDKTDREAGLLARFLVAAPPSRKRPFSETEIDRHLIDAMGRVFDRLLSLSLMPDGDTWTPLEVAMSPEARAAFIEWHNGVDAERFEEPDADIRALLSKAAGTLARLALVVEHAAWTGRELDIASVLAAAIAGAGPMEVSLDSVHRAIAIMDWCNTEARRVYAMLGEQGPELRRREVVDLIEHLIEDPARGISANELRKRTRRFATSDEAEAALEALVQSGAGAWTYAGGGAPGRPTKRFRFIERRDESPPLDPAEEGFGNGDGGQEPQNPAIRSLS